MDRIYIDTNIFIGAFDVGHQTSREIVELLGHFEALPKVLVTSELTLAEFGAKDQKNLQVALALPIFGILSISSLSLKVFLWIHANTALIFAVVDGQ